MYTPAKECYETMEYNRCGESGLMLPKVSLGLWHNFGDASDYENMSRMQGIRDRITKKQRTDTLLIEDKL